MAVDKKYQLECKLEFSHRKVVQSVLNVSVVALLVLTFTVCAAQERSPETYKELLGGGLADVRALTRPSDRRLEFGVNLFLAHEAWIGAVPEDVLLKSVDAIIELGPQRIDINMGPYPWMDGDEQSIHKYDVIVDRIRRAGIKLAINPEFSRIKYRYRSLAEWEAAASHFFPLIAARYRPETFVVVHEPTTMAARMRFKASPAEWAGFAQRLAKLVKDASPGTRIGAGGLPAEQAYFNAFANVKEIEVLTIDIYNLKALPTMNEMIAVARRADKAVYIEETWRPPYFQRKLGQTIEKVAMQNVGNREFEKLDIDWLKTMTRYAQVQGLEGITYVWVQTLFKYVDDGGDVDARGYNREVLKAVRQGERTEIYGALRELIREYGERK